MPRMMYSREERRKMGIDIGIKVASDVGIRRLRLSHLARAMHCGNSVISFVFGSIVDEHLADVIKVAILAMH